MTAFDALIRHSNDTRALSLVTERMGWDQQTMMPEGANSQRGDEFAALESILHERRTDPRIADWLAAIDDAALDEVGRAQIREIRKSYDRNTKVPAHLAAAIARATTKAHHIWAKARAEENVADFLPALNEVLSLRREEAAALASGSDPYDALLQDYEPGTTSADLQALFASMRPRIVALLQAIREKPQPRALSGTFDAALQMQVTERLARAFGYDMTRGRIDTAVHPFSSGSGNDVRITTRTNPNDPFNCFYSTIHEVGHACYEQNIRPDLTMTILGSGASMGVHESQSRIYENQMGRSRAFTGWLFAQMKDTFGDIGVESADDFYRTVNAVKRGFIRTEADEVQYNLHVMLRFDLEQALIRGDLQVGDLESAWNDRFLADFGFAVDKPSNGLLQDVHWSEGLMGYFPTYSLGNVYAGCLYRRLVLEVPQINAELAAGSAESATRWLRGALQQHGSLYEPRDTIRRATGSEPSAEPLLGYLEAKYAEIYQL